MATPNWQTLMCPCLKLKLMDIVSQSYISDPAKFKLSTTGTILMSCINFVATKPDSRGLLVEMISQNPDIFAYDICQHDTNVCQILSYDEIDSAKFKETFIYRLNNEIFIR